MKKRMEKLFTVMLIISVIMSMTSIPAFASEDVKACTLSAHNHGVECYTSTLICEKTQDLVCTAGEHTHSVEAGCYHIHEADCYKHSETCYDGYTCGIEAGTLECTADHHAEIGCADGCTENHHTAACPTHSHESCVKKLVCPGLTEELICGKTEEALPENLKCETPEHTHANTDVQTCYVTHNHKDECYKTELTCTLLEHTHVADCDNAVALIGTVPYTSLAAAVSAANAMAGDEVPVIKLVADSTFDAGMTVARDMEITGAHTVTRADAYTGTMFTVNSGAELILDDLTIDGGNNWTLDPYYYDVVKNGIKGTEVDDEVVDFAASEEGAPVASDYLMKVNGKLTVYDAAIQNNFGYSLINVGANGELVTEGSIITHNSKSGGGLVAKLADGAKWTIEDGTEISYNHTDGGFGVLTEMKSDCDLIINGGEIFENSSVDVNGVLVATFSTSAYIEINGGEIYHNWASYGDDNNWNGVFYLNAKKEGSSLVMTGGHIYENYGYSGAGISTNGDGVSVEIKGGLFENAFSGTNYLGPDSSFGSPLNVTGDVTMGNIRIYNNVSVVEDVTLTGNLFVDWYPVTFTDGGTVKGDITIMRGSETVLEDGIWTGGLVSVDAVEKTSSLTVKSGAVIDGEGVEVLASVASGSYLNAEESAAAQAAAYIEEDGAAVKSSVKYYHRLTNAQMSDVVVTYDYNGGLDAQGWSGVQVTGESPLTHEHPAPVKEGYKLVGWTLEGTDYTAASADESITLVAKWKSAYVAKIVETGVLYETLSAAIADAKASEGDDTIELLADIDFKDDSNKTHEIKGNITITGEYTISRGGYTGTMFKVPSEASLTLDGGVVIDGNNNWDFNSALYEEHLTTMAQQGIDIYSTAYEKNYITAFNTEKAMQYFTSNGTVAAAFMINAAGGTVNLKDVTIQNNFSKTSGVVGVSKSGTTVNLEGAQILHIASTEGNGVVVQASGKNIVTNIKDGTLIDGNHVGGNHGLFKVYSGAVVNMYGGTISNTTGWNSNGVVLGMYGSGSTFNMSGGTIHNNTSVFGPNNGRNAAVYLHNASTMNMNGGTICHNSGRGRGGIDSYYPNSKLNIMRADQPINPESGQAAYTASNHPVIIDNASRLNNMNYDVGHSNGSFENWWITGGIYTQDVDDFCAEGYVCIPYTDTERPDDYIVVPGYRVNYYSVEKTVVTDEVSGAETAEYKTTLVNKYFHMLPRDKFWNEMDERANGFTFKSDEGKVIDTWYTEQEMTNLYDFTNTKLESDLNLYGAWVEDKTPENNNPPIYIGPIVTPTPEPNPAPTPEPPLIEVEDPEVPLEEPDAALAEPEVEIEEEEVPLTDIPKTADNTNLMLWLAMAALSAMALLTMKLTEKKDY